MSSQDYKKRLLSLCDEHLNFLHEKIYLPDKYISFMPHDIDFSKYMSYPSSIPKFLARRIYLRREEYKDDLRRLLILHRSMMQFIITPIDVYIDPCQENHQDVFYLPRLFKHGQKIKVPAGEKVIILGYPSLPDSDHLHSRQEEELFPGMVCLLPGRITEDNTYISFPIEEVSSYLDQKSNYYPEGPYFPLETEETLDTLKTKIVTYLRSRIKWALQNKQKNPITNLYQMKDPNGDLPLEIIVNEMLPSSSSSRDKNIENERWFLREFPLIYSTLDKQVTLYVNTNIHISKASDYLPSAKSEEYILLYPTLASQEKIGEYETPLIVDIRALHVNYAYRLREEDSAYEDFLGDANWIIAPVIVTRSKGKLYAKVKFAPYSLESLLSPSNNVSNTTIAGSEIPNEKISNDSHE